MATIVKQGRIFKDPKLERFTKSSPKAMIAFYSVMVIFFFYLAYVFASVGFGTKFTFYISGLMVWTLIEYLVHRYIFHVDRYIRGAKRFQYIVHGVHHEQPADKERLFMPPILGTLIAVLLFVFWYMVLGEHSFTFMAGITNGYLLYAFIHYTVHTNPNTKLFRHQWYHHALHHYRYSDKGFGISTTFWDRVFRTMPPKQTNYSEQGLSKN